MSVIIISENTIDAVLAQFEMADFEKAVADLALRQPNLMSYWASEDFDLLTQAEKELFLYLMLILVESVEKERGKLPPLSSKAIENAEERNWELLDTITAKRFRDRMDIFFKDYAQEDLLAFVEDNLVEDDDSTVTKEGREPMFVALKSVIDVLSV